MDIPDWSRARLRRALDALPPRKRDCARELLERAHRHAMAVLNTAGAASLANHDLGVAALGQAALDPVAEAEIRSSLHHVPFIANDGAIWGVGLYRQLDVGWITSIIAWMIYSDRIYAPFPAHPQTIRIPNKTTIALLGDWGGGPASLAGRRVGRAVERLKPDYTIHLGDVYYFGGLLARERLNLVDIWPGAPGTSFALNSNHEMYAGAQGYFKIALNPRRRTPFTAQQGNSYFALENDAWILVGLDSAYFSDWCELSMVGRLDEGQLAFLEEQASKGKQMVVFSHHEGLVLNGTATTPFWAQVAPLLPRGGYWYWGHAHAGIVYTPQPGAAQGAQIHGRCVGHGCIPQGRPWGLDAVRSGPNPTVAWFEETPVEHSRGRVSNGFALLTLEDDRLTEQFFDEDGNQTYSASNSAAPEPRIESSAR
ncbi:metallophosphoesterase family protein [Sorangium sp. So ce1000]|uniref:metallophosphoesterase family protein n=1 Tax=Sorangium sp. So ce1000 TaxID=3133325 RepID=UPI003F62D692